MGLGALCRLHLPLGKRCLRWVTQQLGHGDLDGLAGRAVELFLSYRRPHP